MPVIRKKLEPAEVYPEDIRYNAETEQVQRNINGDWVDSPESDPRNQTTLPARITSDTACDAAQSVSDAIKGQIDQTIEAIENTATVFTVAGLILGLFTFGVFEIFIALALALGNAMIDAGAGALNTALTDPVWQQFTCILNCHMTGGGRIEAGSLPAIEVEITDQIGGLGAIVLNSMLSLAGEGGINNLASLGTSTGDCSECGCESCNDKFEVQFGTILGTFAGYLRVQSVVDDGRSKITLIALEADPDLCCTLIDARTLEPVGVSPFANGVHINCGDAITFPNLQFGLSLGGCYNYLGAQLDATDTRDFVIEFLFGECPP